MNKSLSFIKIPSIPEINLGDNLINLLVAAIKRENLTLEQGDIIVITHKIISKSLGLVKSLDSIASVSALSSEIAKDVNKDPRFVELILKESEKLYSCERDILLGLRKDGFLCCNSGIDQSNSGEMGNVVILPQDSNIIAKELSELLSKSFDFRIPVIICDTHGRVLREGTTGVVVGSYGISPTRTYKNKFDREGRPLLHTNEAIADELAGAATFVMGQGSESIPAVIIRGSGLEYCEESCDKLKRRIENMLLKPTGKCYTLQKI